MKKVKIGENTHKSSFDKAFDEKENEILTPIISEQILVSSQPNKLNSFGIFDISSVQLENLVSLYTDENNKKFIVPKFGRFRRNKINNDKIKDINRRWNKFTSF